MLMDSCPRGDTFVVLSDFKQPLALRMMAMSHLLVITAVDQDMKAPQWSLIWENSEAADSWMLVPGVGLATLNLVPK